MPGRQPVTCHCDYCNSFNDLMPSFPKALQRYGFFPNPQTFHEVFSPRPGRAELSERNQSGPDTGTFRASAGSFAMVSDRRGRFRLQIGENENFSQRVIFYAAEHVFAKMRAFFGLDTIFGRCGWFWGIIRAKKMVRAPIWSPHLYIH